MDKTTCVDPRTAWIRDLIKFEPDHNTSSPDCWCEPEIEELDNGDLLVIHRDKSEGN